MDCSAPAKLLRTFEIPQVVCIYAVEAYGQGLYLAMKEQANSETRSEASTTVWLGSIDVASFIWVYGGYMGVISIVNGDYKLTYVFFFQKMVLTYVLN